MVKISAEELVGDAAGVVDVLAGVEDFNGCEVSRSVVVQNEAGVDCLLNLRASCHASMRSKRNSRLLALDPRPWPLDALFLTSIIF